MKEIAGGWDKHKKVVITGAQIITILTLLLGVIGNYRSTNQNAEAIGTQNQWMKDAIKAQASEINDLRISNAILTVEYDDLKDRVTRDEEK